MARLIYMGELDIRSLLRLLTNDRTDTMEAQLAEMYREWWRSTGVAPNPAVRPPVACPLESRPGTKIQVPLGTPISYLSTEHWLDRVTLSCHRTPFLQPRRAHNPNAQAGLVIGGWVIRIARETVIHRTADVCGFPRYSHALQGPKPRPSQ
jgi:hypothetical protein